LRTHWAPALITYLQGSYLRLCNVVQVIQPRTGTVLAFTDHDGAVGPFALNSPAAPADSNTLVYKAGLFTASAKQQENDLQVGNWELRGGFESDSISALDLGSGEFDDAEIYSGIAVWDRPDIPIGWDGYGNLGNIHDEAPQWRAEYRDLFQRASTQICDAYVANCRWILGDQSQIGGLPASCNVDLAPYTTTFVVDSVVSAREFVVQPLGNVRLSAAPGITSGPPPSDYFNGGIATWGVTAGGFNNTRKAEIKTYDAPSRTVVLARPMFYAIAAGDTGSMHGGCKHNGDDCYTKFNNRARYGGYLNLLGVDKMVRGE
jgi:uncharacterized phage protein (TIGR02218 family)